MARPNEHRHFNHASHCSIWVGTYMAGVCNCQPDLEQQMEVARQIMDEHAVALRRLADKTEEVYAEYEISPSASQPLQADDGGKESPGEG